MVKSKRSKRPVDRSIGFIGAGNMAEALIRSLIAGGTPPSSITASDVLPERIKRLKQIYKISVSWDNLHAVEEADVLFLAVKPQQIDTVLEEISRNVRRAQLVISIAAGISTRHIEALLPKGVAVIRAMPNLPVLVGAGAVAISRGRCAQAKHAALARDLFSSSGIVIELPENMINAVTALSGSGPGYTFFFCEVLENAGIKMGLSPEVSRLLTRQTLFGAGKMLQSLSQSASELRRNVSSRGGTTEAAITSLEQDNFSYIVRKALFRAKDRAQELSR